eukprot:CAMPEP_0176228288 /NCGR_PEP_ID=MMETSP0121_2-20121125/23197_1 /TAXON_ID=160619 /ORGANISM="Kryptoperidinium foliaceum, Strain CCMP 1326" /LENGTH=38 /DNA_ID= /DNA_START= /DNA_END= /DNA_ORIENTATION=
MGGPLEWYNQTSSFDVCVQPDDPVTLPLQTQVRSSAGV